MRVSKPKKNSIDDLQYKKHSKQMSINNLLDPKYKTDDQFKTSGDQISMGYNGAQKASQTVNNFGTDKKSKK